MGHAVFAHGMWRANTHTQHRQRGGCTYVASAFSHTIAANTISAHPIHSHAVATIASVITHYLANAEL